VRMTTFAGARPLQTGSWRSWEIGTQFLMPSERGIIRKDSWQGAKAWNGLESIN
jgi:hypothetical protein